MKINDTLYPTQGTVRGIGYSISPKTYRTTYSDYLERSCVATVSRSRYAPFNCTACCNITRANPPTRDIKTYKKAQQSMAFLMSNYNTYPDLDLAKSGAADYGIKKLHSNTANLNQSNLPIIINYDYRKLVGQLYVIVGKIYMSGSNKVVGGTFYCPLTTYITTYKNDNEYYIVGAFIGQLWLGDFYQNFRQQTLAAIDIEPQTVYDFGTTVEKTAPIYFTPQATQWTLFTKVINPPTSTGTPSSALICNLPVFNCNTWHTRSDNGWSPNTYQTAYDTLAQFGGIYTIGIPDEADTMLCGYADQSGYIYYLPKENDVEIIRKMAATYGIMILDGAESDQSRAISTGTSENDLLAIPHLIIPVMENDSTYNGGYIYTGDGTAAEITANLEQLHESERTTIIINGGNPYDNGYDPDLIDDNDYVDTIDLTSPTLTGIDAFNRSYIINRNDVDELGRLFWSGDDSIIDLIKQAWSLFGEKPINGVINLMLFPFDVRSKTGSTTTTENIILGSYDTEITAYRLAQNANARYSMGTFKWFTKFDNSFLDYTPYTEAELYIPFFGVMPLPNEHFLGKQLEIELVVDFITGAGTAIIYVVDGDRKHPVIYRNATIGIQIPVSGDDAQQRVTAILDNSLKAFDTFDKIAGGIVDVATGNFGEAWGELTGGVKQLASPEFKPSTMYQTAGSSTPECSLYLPIKPYIILYYPDVLDVEYYAHTIGFATMQDCVIGNCTGFNVFANVDLSGVAATQSEIDTIKGYLETGVYI